MSVAEVQWRRLAKSSDQALKKTTAETYHCDAGKAGNLSCSERSHLESTNF